VNKLIHDADFGFEMDNEVPDCIFFSLLGRSDTIKTEAIGDPPTRKGNRRTKFLSFTSLSFML